MALLNRPLTKAEIATFLTAARTSGYSDRDMFWHASIQRRDDPTPSCVHYSGGRHRFVPPHMFHWGHQDKSPSDSIWMIPTGT